MKNDPYMLFIVSEAIRSEPENMPEGNDGLGTRFRTSNVVGTALSVAACITCLGQKLRRAVSDVCHDTTSPFSNAILNSLQHSR